MPVCMTASSEVQQKKRRQIHVSAVQPPITARKPVAFDAFLHLTVYIKSLEALPR